MPGYKKKLSTFKKHFVKFPKLIIVKPKTERAKGIHTDTPEKIPLEGRKMKLKKKKKKKNILKNAISRLQREKAEENCTK